MKNPIDITTDVLLIAGALNWGLTVLKFNLVEKLFSSIPYAVNIVYALVGLAGVWAIVRWLKK